MGLRSIGVPLFLLIVVLCSCDNKKEHLAPAVLEQDSVSVMTSYGVNTLVSDSGVIKYRIVTERWDVNQVKQPNRWTFIKGVFFEQFDENFNLQAYVQADTAWYYDKLKLWELRGRVRVRNINGTIYNSEELWWDGIKHELYSYKYSTLITPERTLNGTYFRSDEKMTNYIVSNSVGSFVKNDIDGKQEEGEITDTLSTDSTDADSITEIPVRPAAKASAKQHKEQIQE